MKKRFSSRKLKKRLSKNLMSFLVIFLIVSNFLSVLAQPVNAAVAFTINNTDSYGIQGMTLHQFDGANPTVTPKASVLIKGVAENTGLNGLAVSSEENALYASTYSYSTNTSKLYKIKGDGTAQAVTSLTGIAGNSVIFEGKYYYLYGTGGKPYIGSYNLTTGEKKSVELKNYNLPIYQDMGGDLVFDRDGYIWYFATNNLIQFNPNTGSVVRTLPITNSDGVAIEFGARGISFLPNGNMLFVAGQSNPKFYTFNPNTMSTTYMGAMTGGLIFDLASAVTPQFEPNAPLIESQKSAIIQQKADGNTNAQNPEVGDTLLYTIKTRNTVENSLVKNLTISDTIPTGLTYVPGSLTVDGQAVTDAEGDDKGQTANGDVVGQFGDVTDREWHTLTFQVTVNADQAGLTIPNTAVVKGDNVSTPNEPKAEVTISPKEEIDACARPVSLMVNGSFEELLTSNSNNLYNENDVPGWRTTASDKLMQVSPYNSIITNVPRAESQFAELNANEFSTLYQDVNTTPGQDLYWRLSHRGVEGTDTMHVKIGSTNIPLADLQTVAVIRTGNDGFKYYSGKYTVPAGQEMTRIAFESVDAAGGLKTRGNLVDDIFFGTEPCVVAEKTVSPEGDVFAGDELMYEVNVKNNGGDIAANVVFEDAIPEGTEYVPGSLKITNRTGTGDLTDGTGDDAGYFDADNNKVVVELGDLANTTNLPDGITVQFKVKALSTETNKVIANKALINYENLLVNETKTTETNEVTTTVLPNPEIDACARPVALINGSFEEPVVVGSEYSIERDNYVYALFPEDIVPGWNTTASDNLIELWDESVSNHPFKGIKGGVPDGKQVAELNANEASALYQDVETTPGQTIYWRLSHQGGADIDTMDVRIGTADLSPDQLPVVANLETGPDEWKQYSGTYTVPAGQTMTRFAFKSTDQKDPYAGNILDDIFLGTEPCVVAEKTVSPDGDVFAGDELTYEVNVKNNGGDVAANSVFEDAIPEGTEYVPGSLKITNGPGTGDLTDENDDDAGQFDGEKVIVKLGDLANTTDLPDGITVQFKVKTLSTDANKVVTNKALINYDNLLINESQSTETNEVTTTVLPKPVIDACARPVALINGSFEEGPELSSTTGNDYSFNKSEVPGWSTTDSVFEIWNYAKNHPNAGPGHVSSVSSYPPPPDGGRYAELNATQPGMLYQDVQTSPGQTIYWRLSHMGRFGVDTMQVRIGAVTANPYDAKVQRQISDGTAWGTYTGTYTVPAGQTVTRFGFEAVNAAGGDKAFGNFLDNIFLGTEPCVVAEKTVSPEGEVNAGDELTYEVNVKNNGGDIAADALFEDAIPEGTEYVPGSLKITNGTGTVDLTDADDSDAGRFDGQKVIVKLGDLPNTDDLPNGMTVQFKVKALVSDTITQVKNKAQIDYTNLLTNEDKVVDSNETTTPLTYQKPVLDSKKSATIKQKADGNTDTEHPEVGDTLTYTIQTQNTISNSLVKNMTIKDQLPEGLEYIPGTLKVDGQPATDDEDDDNGHYVDGTFTGQFGDILDTDVHKIEFEVKVLSGQAGKDIKNIATISGDNFDVPSRPENEVKVYPRLPVLESDKTATNLEAGKEVFEVGDTVVYTIKTRNTVSDGVVTALKISDTIPAGLTYVAGSLKIDGQSATDAVGDDNGHVDNNAVQGTFGDVTDTEWHTVEFQAKINSGQSEQTIENIATVNGDNIDKPNKPEETVNVTPKKPNLVSEKSYTIQEKAAENTDAEHPEVGDTLLYTIKTQNTVEDSLVKNMVISDKLPAGLEYVSGSLKVDGVAVSDAEDNDDGHYVDGIFTGQFGDVRDTAEHKIEFLVKVQSGQAGKDIKNIATISGDNLETPDRPETEVKVYPRLPDLESVKEAKNVEEGKNTFEVGDTIEYTIQTRNTVSEGVVKNLVISDTIPAGLEYVPGTLKVDGTVVTDSQDGDNGHSVDGKLAGQFGDVTDTEWHTVTFHAKVKQGQAGQVIQNKATVDGDNIDTPDEPTKEVDVNTSKITLSKVADKQFVHVGDIVTYTIEAKNAETGATWNGTIKDPLPENVELVSGSTTLNGTALADGDVWNEGQLTVNPVTVKAGETATITFQVKVLESALNTTVENIATGHDPEQPMDPIETTPTETEVVPSAGELKSSKAVFNSNGDAIDGQKVKVGDELTYKITAENIKAATTIVNNVKVVDDIPEGLSYVPGTLTVNGEAKDDSAVNGQVVTVADIGSLKGGEKVEVAFTVTVTEDAKGEITNIATVEGSVPGENPGDPDQPSEPQDPGTEVKVPADITLSKVADKKIVHVGDSVTYTIEAKNGEAGGIWNGTIEDQLPTNVELVSGSTTLNGAALADGDVWSEGQLTVRPVTVKAGETATVTFQVKVLEGALNSTVENIATAYDPDQPLDPDEPGKDPENPITSTPTETEVVSSAGELSSKKAVFNANGDVIDGQKVKVGDQLTYKITAENIKAATTIVNNVKVVDDIPAGLSYVPGTLTVNGEAKDDSAVNGQVVTVADIGSLKGGEKVEVAFTVTVTEDAKGEITNIATVEGTVPGENPGDPDQPNEPEKPGTDVKVPADITLSKVADKKTVHVGDIVTYTIEAKNAETGGIWNGTIKDSLPANVELVSGSTTLNGKALADNDVWSEGQLKVSPVTVKAGETATVTFQVKVLEGALNSTVENIATAFDPDQPLDPTEPGKDPENPITTTPTETEVVSSAGELSSKKAVFNANGDVIDGQKVKVGDELTYKITAENIKAATTIVNNVKVVDDIPAGLSYVPGTLTVNGEAKDDSAVNGQVVTVADIGSLKGGEKVEVAFTVTVTADAKGEITNIATVEGTVPGENPGDPNQPSEPQKPGTEVKVPADITLSKVADKKVVHVGDSVTYTIEAKNSESGGVWNGTIEDQLPANVELVSGSTTLNGKALADEDVWSEGLLTVNPVTLQAGETATITFQVKVLESAVGTTVENIATAYDPDQPLDPNEPGKDPENPITTTPAETEVVPSAGELSSAKAVFNSEGKVIDGQKVKVGDELTYKITVENIKAATTIVNNIKVVDDIPAGLSYVPGTLTVNGEAKDDSVVNGQVVTVADIGSLKGGEKVEVAFTVKVTAEAKGEITNIATVEGTVPGENPGDPDQPSEPQKPGTEVKVPADITLTKVADKKVVNVGDSVTYTIEAKNGETGGIWNGTIKDPLPANVELVSGSTTLNGKALADEDVWSEEQLTVSPVTVKAGETATITFQVKVLEGALNTTVENIATAYDPDQPLDPNEPGKDPENPITTPPTGTEVVPGAGELSSAKAVFNREGEAIDGQQVKVGDQLTYKITAENIKAATTIVNNVKVVDNIPEGLSYVPGTLTVNGEAKDDSAVKGQVVTVADIGSLKGGEKVEVAFTVTVTKDATGDITNIATVEGTVPGENPGGFDRPSEPKNSGTKTKLPADITLSKAVDKETVRVGDIVTYTIEAKNGETGGKWNGTIQDQLVKQVELVANTTKLNGKALTDGDVWSKGQLTVSPVTLRAGETATITFQVKVLESAANSTVENIAIAYDPDQPLEPNEPGKDPENAIKTTPTKTKVVPVDGDVPPSNDGDNDNDGTDPVKPDNEPAREPQKLPQTGEDQSNYMMIGLLMIGTALIGLLVRRRFVAK